MEIMTRRPSAVQVSAALMLCVNSVLVAGIDPIMTGALLNEHRIDMATVGHLTMTEILMLAVGIVVANVWQPLTMIRRNAILMSLLGIALNFACIHATSSTELIALRGTLGLSEGILVWTGTALVVRAKSPSRLFAVSAFLQLLTQGGLATYLSMVTIPVHGANSVFFAFAMASVLNMLLACALPKTIEPLPTEDARPFKWRLRHLRAPAVAFLQIASVGALWGYIEPTGQAIGFTPNGIQTAISLTLGAAMLGTIVAMLTVQRWRSGAVLLLSSAAMVAVMLLMYTTPFGGLTRFAVLLGLCQIVTMFALPFQAAYAFTTDSTGRVTTVIPLVELLGQALGPLLSSLVVLSNDSRPSLLAAAAVAGIAMLLMVRVPSRLMVEARS